MGRKKTTETLLCIFSKSLYCAIEKKVYDTFSKTSQEFIYDRLQNALLTLFFQRKIKLDSSEPFFAAVRSTRLKKRQRIDPNKLLFYFGVMKNRKLSTAAAFGVQPRHVSNGTRTTTTRRAGPDRKPGATLEINYRCHRVCVMDLNGCFNRSLNGRGVPPGLFSARRRCV